MHKSDRAYAGLIGMSAIHGIRAYERYAGRETIRRIEAKARPLRDMHILHMNSTYYGGGVSQILSSLTLLMNGLGIRTGWRVVHGPPDFFSVTKKFRWQCMSLEKDVPFISAVFHILSKMHEFSIEA